MSTTLILCLLGAVCIAGAVLAMWYALTFGKNRQPEQPLPGREGGGTYIMTVEGLREEADAARLKAALHQVPRTHAEIRMETSEVCIHYEGFPALDLLDSLRKQAEDAGFTVTRIR